MIHFINKNEFFDTETSKFLYGMKDLDCPTRGSQLYVTKNSNYILYTYDISKVGNATEYKKLTLEEAKNWVRSQIEDPEINVACFDFSPPVEL